MGLDIEPSLQIPIPEWLRGDVLDVRKEVIFFSEGMRSGFHRQPRVSLILQPLHMLVY